MYDITWLDQLILVCLWVGVLYGLFGLAVGWLALTDLEWRQEITARLRAARLGLARGLRWRR